MKTIVQSIRLALIAIIAYLIIGCMATPTIDVVKPWEGHYFTTEEIEEKVQNMQLDKNESVWILSNRTLKRVLKNNTK